MKDPEEKNPPPAGDHSCRFLFDKSDIRGEIVQLNTALRDILSVHQYAPGVSRLLGELLTASVLLCSTLKFEGRLVLQARSEGQIPLLMAECNSNGEIRGIARGADQATASHFEQLLGSGSLAITVEPHNGQRYQGIVPLTGNSLSQCLDAYFERSEQLTTRLWLACDGERAGGLLLQQLPGQITLDPTERSRQWQHAYTMAATVQSRELLELGTEDLLYRLYHEDPPRLFASVPVNFRCSCSRQRTLGALAAIDPAELESLLQEQGCITMDCEFCNQQYRYLPADLQTLLNPGSPPILH